MSIHYYDETSKQWVNIGGKVSGNKISVEVDHFTKFAVLATASEQAQPQTVSLIDIHGHWAESRIKEAVTRSIVSGYPDGTFRPDEKITRAQFSVLLARSLGLTGTPDNLAFADAETIPSWAQAPVAAAVKHGLVSGYEDNTFRPAKPISRAEMTALIVCALGLKLDSGSSLNFADTADIPDWAKPYVATAVHSGLVKGRDGNRFAPNDTATRAEGTVLILNMLQKK